MLAGTPPPLLPTNDIGNFKFMALDLGMMSTQLLAYSTNLEQISKQNRIGLNKLMLRIAFYLLGIVKMR